ncbi:GTP-binding protein Era [Kamptonema sp. PCC 6506]|nr:GTP-binding protein Era [Kamptonema sp. PCC 6506]
MILAWQTRHNACKLPLLAFSSDNRENRLGNLVIVVEDSTGIDLLSTMIPAAPAGYKSGFAGIIGRPNVGKSTLMNQLVGQKIAITSPVAQTTRNRLRGILTTEEAQIIFVDTPGIHKPHHQLGKVLVHNAQLAIHSVDVLLFVVDASVPAGGGDRYIVDLLVNTQTPVILGLNKSDQQPSESQAQLDNTYTQLIEAKQWPIVKFSALTGEGVEALQQILIEHLEPGPYYYPPDLVTDQPERFIMGELIREQILLLTREEIPHSVAIAIDIVEEAPTITRVLATINVERDSQKGIVIGKGGSMLKEIGSAARQQIQKLIDGKVHLELFVKVQPKWRQSRTRLAELGYRVEE